MAAMHFKILWGMSWDVNRLRTEHLTLQGIDYYIIIHKSVDASFKSLHFGLYLDFPKGIQREGDFE